jgi:hypothetical protein
MSPRQHSLVLVLGLVLGLGLACRRGPPAETKPGPDAARVIATAPPDAPRPLAVAPAPTEQAQGEEPLEVEERERNPRSQTVKLKLGISPAVRATVHWGRKRLAETKPGDMTVELERPRGSGPLDLVVRADGFLPHHLRLFTDRDDRLSLRLVRPEESHALLGYKGPRSPDPTAPPAAEPLNP